MRRFATHVFVYTLGATLIWWLSHRWIAPISIDAARLLHQLIGLPAPYLIVETLDYFWLSPPMQLFVGLVFASSWLRRPQRLYTLLIGGTLLWFLVVMHIFAISSPYLGAGQTRYLIGTLLAKGHLIALPILFWLILTPLPKSSRLHVGPAKFESDPNRPIARYEWKRPTLAVLICLIVPAALWTLSVTDPLPVKTARKNLAAAMRSGDIDRITLSAARLGKIQERETHRRDQNLYYLVGRLCQAAGNVRLAREMLLHPAIHPKARAALRRELNFRPAPAP
ncbi:MAG: hypothetical protein ACE5EQ_01250 [Phycisphaerae bacterium]